MSEFTSISVYKRTHTVAKWLARMERRSLGEVVALALEAREKALKQSMLVAGLAKKPPSVPDLVN